MVGMNVSYVTLEWTCCARADFASIGQVDVCWLSGLSFRLGNRVYLFPHHTFGFLGRSGCFLFSGCTVFSVVWFNKSKEHSNGPYQDN